MKFGKKLRATVNDSYEEWRPMFMSYKDLKKRIHPRANNDDLDSKDSDAREPEVTENDSDQDATDFDTNKLCAAVREAEKTHTEFFTCFRREVDKVNEFFLDKQEDYIIEHQQLSAKVDEFLLPGRATRQEVNRLCQRLTNFHGELVLLENFSSVNYTGFRKILKKHDKKTGLKMQGVYLKTVLITPFFLSDTVRKLILQTESQLAQLDKIRKFRRTNPPSDLTFEGRSPAFRNTQLSTVPPLPPASSPGTRVILDQPHPHAFISPRSALWRLYRDAREYGRRIQEAMSNSTSTALPRPPAGLIALVDEVQAAELGLNGPFIDSVVRASNYCIASEQEFTMGFFVFGPHTKLQLFKSIHKGTFITRNLRGKVRVRCFEDCNMDSKKGDLPQDAKQDVNESAERCAKETRNGLTNGPWPAITTCGASSHLEWAPETWCAVFYVCMPALDLDVLPRYDLRPVGGSLFEVIPSTGGGWPFTKILC